MREEIRTRLEDEKLQGSRALHAYREFIEPFISEKRLVLFEAFQEVSVTDTDSLVEIKRQLISINALETEIKTIINTGKMAEKAIANEDNKDESRTH